MIETNMDFLKWSQLPDNPTGQGSCNHLVRNILAPASSYRLQRVYVWSNTSELLNKHTQVVCKTKEFTSAGLSLKQYKSLVVGVIGMPDKKN